MTHDCLLTKSPSFGYVEFETTKEAESAIGMLHQQVFMGRRINVQFHIPRPRRTLTIPNKPSDPTKTLFIGNMSFEMTDKDLNELFREIRNVLDVRVAIDRRTGQPRGFAHADFIDIASATEAKNKLQTVELYGRKLRVDFSLESQRGIDGSKAMGTSGGMSGGMPRGMSGGMSGDTSGGMSGGTSGGMSAE